MAYYSGLCTSYQDLADILVEKCQVHGWAWADGILSKDDLFVKMEVNNNLGISLLGGTGLQGGILQNSSISPVRLGSPHYTELQVVFPADYHLFVFANEVYLIAKSDIDKFYYLAWGKSSLIQNTVGNGLWLSATACHHPFYRAINIEVSGGGGGWGAESAVAPFFNRYGWGGVVFQTRLSVTVWMAYCGQMALVVLGAVLSHSSADCPPPILPTVRYCLTTFIWNAPKIN